MAKAVEHEAAAPQATSEHHVTLYYYDQAGDLVATVPPAAFRPDGQATHATTYAYDALGNPRRTSSPDAGTARVAYDFAGRPRARADAEQAARARFAYTRYDGLGRVRAPRRGPRPRRDRRRGRDAPAAVRRGLVVQDARDAARVDPGLERFRQNTALGCRGALDARRGRQALHARDRQRVLQLGRGLLYL